MYRMDEINSGQRWRRDELRRVVSQARLAFRKHEVRSSGDRWWRCAFREDEDAEFSVLYGFDVFCGHHAAVTVEGDIEGARFAHFGGDSADPADRVRWIGRRSPDELSGYLVEKASVGVGGDWSRVWVFDSALAALDLRDHYMELRYGGYCGGKVEFLLDVAVEVEEEPTSRDLLQSRLRAGGVELPRAGEHVSPFVVYAWAALERLTQLLEEEGQ